MRKKLFIAFGIGLVLLAVCLFFAGKGYLFPLVFSFPAYIMAIDKSDTIAGIVASAQFPLYLYFFSMGTTKKKKWLIVAAIIFIHLLLIRVIISRKTTQPIKISTEHIKESSRSLLFAACSREVLFYRF